MAIDLIQPAPVVRDENGYWLHPCLPKFRKNAPEGRNAFRDWQANQQLEICTIQLECDWTGEGEHPYWSGSDNCNGWEPSRPDGEGWFCLAIDDTEEGPTCWWARRVELDEKGHNGPEPRKGTQCLDTGLSGLGGELKASIHASAEEEVIEHTAVFKKESALCALFISEFNKLKGWTCYPETGGFDVLVVHESGRQIGVEAKLKLNAKVAEQILPEPWYDRYGQPGPDHRLVIVATITDASAGIARMLRQLGVEVLAPRMTRTFHGDAPTFELEHKIDAAWGQVSLFDWNPPERCQLPSVVPDLPAGVPAPVRLTPWKEGALRVLAILRRQGFITAKQIAEQGIGTTTWTQGVKPWLRKGEVRGQWVPTEHLPSFDKQHPDVYAKVLESMGARA